MHRRFPDEADQLASRIAVIDRGKVIAEGAKGTQGNDTEPHDTKDEAAA